MAQNTLYAFDVTAGNNADIAGISVAEGWLPSTVNNFERAWMAIVKKDLLDKGGQATVGGTANAITVTSSLPATYQSLYAGLRILLKPGADNSGATTLNLDSLGAKAVRKIVGGTDVALSGGEILNTQRAEVVYDTAANAAAGAWILLNPSSPAIAALSLGLIDFANLGLTCSVGASALTIALKGADGNDPSASNPVVVAFRNVTAATGTPSILTVTAATSLVISSGSTMGFTSGSPGRLWIVAFNDGGTFRLGAVNCLSGVNIMALSNGIYSSTAEGGAGAADNAQVIYTGTAVTSKALTILGYIEATKATAGTWATAPSLVKVLQKGDDLPGTIVQTRVSQDSAVATGTTALPNDDTIPQNTEGTQFMSQAITPTSAVNVLEIEHNGFYGLSVASPFVMSLIQDSTANALAAVGNYAAQAGRPILFVLRHWMKAGVAVSTTFAIRVGDTAADTVTFNGVTAARSYGGVAASRLSVTEYMA